MLVESEYGLSVRPEDLAKYQDLIRTVVFKMGGATTPRADLEDVVQNINLRLIETGLANFDPTRGSIEGYISVIAKTMTIDAWRKNQRLPIAASEAMDSSERGANNVDSNHGVGEGSTGFSVAYLAANSLEDQSDDTLTMLLRDEQRDLLDSLIKQLPPDDQHFLLVSFKNDFSYKEYAARLGMTEVALRVRKHRIGERIRDLIAKIKS
jgi:RNA polymerase sigma factor (sigma-70 family)